MVPFEKVSKIRVEYISRQLLGPRSSSPHTENIYVGGGRVVSAPLMIKVMSTQAVKRLQHFKLFITFLLTGLILV